MNIASQQTTQQSKTVDTPANNIRNSIETIESDSNHKLIGDYEQSVTEKENALMHTFSNLIENNIISTSPAQSQQNNVTNGKLLDFTHTLNDDHPNEIAKTPISNGNGHTLIETLDNKM